MIGPRKSVVKIFGAIHSFLHHLLNIKYAALLVYRINLPTENHIIKKASVTRLWFYVVFLGAEPLQCVVLVPCCRLVDYLIYRHRRTL